LFFYRQILIIIQKQIELQKIELDYREREIKLRERELAEREKRFNERSSETISMNSVTSEPPIVTKPIPIEENTQLKSEIIIDQDIKNVFSKYKILKIFFISFCLKVSQEESVEKSIPLIIKLSDKNSSEQTSVISKNNRKSRFSKLIVDPSIFPSQEKPVVDLYSDDLDDNQSSSSIKKTTFSKILAPTDQPIISISTDLKVTSSNSIRKVEIQSGNIDKTISKGSSHDLRLTLSKNRPKQQLNNDDQETNGNQITNDDEQILKIKSNNETKQQR